MNTAYLILGSNQGNRLQHLRQALELLEERAGKISLRSDIFVTAPWGNSDQEEFYNQAICMHTPLEASELLSKVLAIEEMLGRKRDGRKWMARSMDIDILFFNDSVISIKELEIPHPHIHHRRFVLLPMAQIAGSLVHPVLKKTLSELLADCPDELRVEKLN